MSLIQLQGLDYGVGGPLLLDGVDLSIERGERVCIVGRNGAGKSTLMKLIAGELQPDDGEIRLQSGVVVARMAQEVPQDAHGSVFDVVAQGLGDIGELLAAYHHALDRGDMQRLGALQARIEARHGWDIDRRIGQVIEQLELPGAIDFAALSGGMKRRVLLAQALVRKPDVLLLDEPTNHLDIEAIDWLEGFLKSFAGSLIFVTHDRGFLRALATRIVEIDRGKLTSWPGDHDNYLRRREERLHAEAMENARFDKLLAQEEVWIRQGIKARRTRNEGRVRALQALRRERAQRRELSGNVKMEAAQAQGGGRKVIEATHVSQAFGGRVLLQDVSTTIMRGDRVGIIGPNGAGKSTLLKILLGEMKPDAGEVNPGTGLQIAYFDQHRSQLDETRNALENVAEGRDYVEINGARKHAIGYLQDFLFTPERARAPITRLSGGERNRLLLARLFAQPSNLLVMDEPTNDLDVETLELLEELLGDYKGTLLLVSHDRDFLDNVVTSTLVLEGDGRLGEYVGGYTDWLRQRPAPSQPPAAKKDETAAPVAAGSDSANTPAAKKKLGYRDQRELERLPARIESLEADIAARSEAMNDAAFFQRPAAKIAEANQQLAALQQQLDAAYARWAELDG
ncbi:MAG: ATP-binding cassette domain-containing protein [Pseudoxanthomonas sp.]